MTQLELVFRERQREGEPAKKIEIGFRNSNMKGESGRCRESRMAGVGQVWRDRCGITGVWREQQAARAHLRPL